MKTVSFTSTHVYLPVDLTSEGWADATTKRYEIKGADGKRLKYDVTDSLADFLIERDQAMEVPPDKKAPAKP